MNNKPSPKQGYGAKKALRKVSVEKSAKRVGMTGKQAR